MGDHVLPCPFCGGEPTMEKFDPVYTRPSEWAVHCQRCDVSLDGRPSPAEAAALWNRRADILAARVTVAGRSMTVAELIAAHEREQWQPIETAPNWESILVFRDDGSVALVGAADNDYAWEPYTGRVDYGTKIHPLAPAPGAARPDRVGGRVMGERTPEEIAKGLTRAQRVELRYLAAQYNRSRCRHERGRLWDLRVGMEAMGLVTRLGPGKTAFWTASDLGRAVVMTMASRYYE